VGGSVYDVIVVGAGHAGCEAAAAAARMGASVLVVTLSRETIGQMPCNPAVGGIGKGHLVAEVDALGGLQGWVADRSGIQFRVLNLSRGPAVWGPRVQCDKRRYSTILRRYLEGLRGVTLLEEEVTGLLLGGAGVAGVRTAAGRRVRGRSVVLTTGTFLGGLLHHGEHREPGGRYGEAPSTVLGEELRRLGLRLRRFKTGTPPRLEVHSIDLGRLRVQEGDPRPQPFSWRTGEVTNRAVCWVTRTPAVVRRIIGDNLDRSPLYSGRIEGVGPRYCPSIEDKVVRFPHHEHHTLFLEPEELGGGSIYVNGLATSLPEDVQEAVVRSVPGLEHARFLRYGYAVEYDVVGSRQVDHRLAVRDVPGLFVAGQLLGTSGYEEAAAQGLLAGINAVRGVRGEPPFVLGRDEGYIGVLVDDLVLCDHREPYRMLTSRAEHRLLLGVGSARERLMPLGARLGLVPQTVFHVEQRRWEARRAAVEALRGARLRPNRETRALVADVAGVDLSRPTTWAQVLRRQDVCAEEAAGRLELLADLSPEDRLLVVADLRYEGYVARHRREAERVQRLRDVPFPVDLDLEGVAGLSREAIDQLRQFRPANLGEAERLPGVTPAALALLAGRLGRQGVPAGSPSRIEKAQKITADRAVQPGRGE